MTLRQWTPRQLEIARLIATVVVENGQKRGLSYAEIGAELGITRDTVRNHARTMANGIAGLDALAPRMRIWMVMKHPELADAIRTEVGVD